MLLALYANDQAYFNTQLDNAEKYMWNGRCVVMYICIVGGGETFIG